MDKNQKNPGGSDDANIKGRAPETRSSSEVQVVKSSWPASFFHWRQTTSNHSPGSQMLIPQHETPE